MARVSTHGRMVVAMKASTSMIESMASVFILGKMVVNMKATGTMASNTVMVSIVKTMDKSVVENGKKASVLHGLMRSNDQFFRLSSNPIPARTQTELNLKQIHSKISQI